MTTDEQLRQHPAIDLTLARSIAHSAVQHVTKAARANLAAKPDDSHSNLGWDHPLQAYLSQPLGDHFVGLKFSPLTLLIVTGGEITASLPLDKKTQQDAASWLDDELKTRQLKPASAVAVSYTHLTLPTILLV